VGTDKLALAFADTRDVARALLVAEQHTQLCFIGRSNMRSPYERYVREYWRP
jgi:hypothetical protein